MEIKMKITKKVIGAGVLLLLGLILAIGYPREGTQQQNTSQNVKTENVKSQKKAINNSIDKYKTPRKKKKVRMVTPPSQNQFQDEGC